jgi:predicted NAD/FAD-dependent oxidoreductase
MKGANLRCHKSLNDNKYSIAIVGDGIAGLVAGWLLKDAGLAARILKRVTESMAIRRAAGKEFK